MTNAEAKKVEGELCILGGALRGLGSSMSTIGRELEDLTVSESYCEDMGYVVEALGKYAERLAAELDVALMEQKPHAELATRDELIGEVLRAFIAATPVERDRMFRETRRLASETRNGSGDERDNPNGGTPS